MYVEFTGERVTSGLAKLDPISLLNLLRQGGITHLVSMLEVRAEHISRYDFTATTYNFNGKKVADIACGSGYGTDILSNQSPSLVTGIDICSEAVNEASLVYGEAGPFFLLGDGQKLPLASESFDIVTSFETVEHLKDSTAFLDEIKRILTKDGVLIISTPVRQQARHEDFIQDPQTNPFHEREYSIEEFDTLLKAYFNEVDLYGQDKITVEEQNRAVRRAKKLMRLFKAKKFTRVESLDMCHNPAYIVAVCKNKK